MNEKVIVLKKDAAKFIASAFFMVSNDSSREFLNGVGIFFNKEGYLSCAATNGFIGSIQVIGDEPMPELIGNSFIIPKYLRNTFEALSGRVLDCSLIENKLVMKLACRGTSFSFTFDKENYPDVERVTNDSNLKYSASFNPDLLVRIGKRMAGNKSVTFKFDINDGECVLGQVISTDKINDIKTVIMPMKIFD